MNRRSRKICTGLISLTIILTIPFVFFPPAALAIDYTFTTIDVPGATANWGAYGINDSGSIVGTYDDATGMHGFLYVGGSFTAIDVPSNGTTVARGINNSGSIVGTYGLEHGFLYAGGSFTTIDAPGNINWGAYGINDSGSIVGSYGDTPARPGYLYEGGKYTPINVPGVVNWTVPTGINNCGSIVGTYENSDEPGTHRGFLYVGGNFTLIDGPGAVGGTDVNGINDFGEIVGTYYDAAGYHPFLYAGGSFTTIDVPGAIYAGANGINNSGSIVGYYVDANQVRHGFIATPALKPVSIDIEPDHINPKSKGKIEVAILSTKEFDAPGMVDIESLTFGRTGAEESLAFCDQKPKKVNHDKLKDLVCHFYTQDTGFQCGDTEGILKGKTKDGTTIGGSDSIKIVPCK